MSKISKRTAHAPLEEQHTEGAAPHARGLGLVQLLPRLEQVVHELLECMVVGLVEVRVHRVEEHGEKGIQRLVARLVEARALEQARERGDIYTDGGFSGSNTERPALEQLIRDAKRKLFDKRELSLPDEAYK